MPLAITAAKAAAKVVVSVPPSRPPLCSTPSGTVTSPSQICALIHTCAETVHRPVRNLLDFLATSASSNPKIDAATVPKTSPGNLPPPGHRPVRTAAALVQASAATVASAAPATQRPCSFQKFRPS